MNEDSPHPIDGIGRIFYQLSILCGIICVILCGWPSIELKAAEPPAVNAPIYQEAVKQFEAMTHTLYQHKTEVDVKAGTYRYDCVGFVSYALKQVAPQARESAFKALEIPPGRIPSALKYRAFFASLPKSPQKGWQAVTKVTELRPGDVVAWEFKTETTTGHAVVIAEKPVEGPDGTWIVKVYDSTSTPHGEDSRSKDPRAEVLAKNGKRSGLGHGKMALAADPTTGALIGYRWTPQSKTKIVPIAAGRPTS
jgi:hypothetical protein